MNKTLYISLLLCFTFFLSFYSTAQEKDNDLDSGRINNQQSVKVTFNKIEEGISSGNVSDLAGYFSSQLYLNLSNGISGYYSSNQAYYVLEDFFDTYHAAGFKFNNIKKDEANMYATGSYHFLFKGKPDIAQVYVSVRHTGKEWKITQININ